jgi:hypothetical protein
MRLPLTTHIPPDTPNRDLALAALRFREAVQLLDQYGLGHVMTELSQKVKHNDPDIRRMIQGNVDEIIHGFTLFYYFSVWEHCFSTNAAGQIIRLWMAPAEKTRFRALRHVRHSIAHSFNGRRARQDREPFETIMESPEAFVGLVWERNAQTIDLTESQIAFDCRTFFQTLSQAIVGRLLNHSLFGTDPG